MTGDRMKAQEGYLFGSPGRSLVVLGCSTSCSSCFGGCEDDLEVLGNLYECYILAYVIGSCDNKRIESAVFAITGHLDTICVIDSWCGVCDDPPSQDAGAPRLLC